MKNKGNVVAVVVIIVALFLGGGLLLINNLSQKAPESESSTIIPNEVVDEVKEDSVQPVTQSRYVDYSKSAFGPAADKRRVLYFHADWCPVCGPLNKEFIEKADQIPEDVIIFKANYDTETELKKKYAITYQHTFVQVDADGNEVAKWSGGDFSEVMARII